MGDPRGEALNRAEAALKDLPEAGTVRYDTDDGGESGEWWTDYHVEPAEGVHLDDLTDAVDALGGEGWRVVTSAVGDSSILATARTVGVGPEGVD